MINKLHQLFTLAAFFIATYFVAKSDWGAATYLLLLAWFFDYRRVNSQTALRERIIKTFEADDDHVVYDVRDVIEIIRKSK